MHLRWNNTYPVHRAEVDSLSKVKALIEAAVVGSRKRDHKLTSTLVCSVNLNYGNEERRSGYREQGIVQNNVDLCQTTGCGQKTSVHVNTAAWVRTGTPWAIRVLGFMIVTSWCSRSGWDSNSSGASFLITSSSCSAAKPGAPYHVLGSPLKWTRWILHLGLKWNKNKVSTTSRKHEYCGEPFRLNQLILYQCR